MAGPTEMSSYRLSPHAEEDLHEIARYTTEVWVVEQAQRYATVLERCFLSIAAGKMDLMVRLRDRLDGR